MVNATEVTPLPSNGALMGSNGLTVWLGNCLECLLVLDDPASLLGVANPFTHQRTFVIVTSSRTSICSSVLSVFKLPVGLCKDFEAMIGKFWWGHGDSKKIHWFKWSSLYSSKSIRGIGFWDFQKFNYALLAKQVWCLIHQRDTLLFKVFSGKYFPNNSILDAPIHQKCSYAWRSILQARDTINKGQYGRSEVDN